MAAAPRHLASSTRPPRRRTALVVLALALVIGVGVAAGVTVVSARGDDSLRPQDPAATSTSRTSSAPAAGFATSTTIARGPLGSGEPVTLAFVGDMHFEGALRDRLDRDPATAVGPFAEVLRAADLAVGNLESSIAVGGTRADKQYAFRAPPSAIAALRAAGLDAVSMANNHGIDYGPGGLAETLAVARAQPDHLIVGIGGDETEAFAPFTATVRGQRISVIAATQVLDADLAAAWTATADHGGVASAKRLDRLVAAVRAARATSDTVVVFLHWGVEQHTCPSGDQQHLAAVLAGAGADVIVGSHAHRLQAGGRLGEAVVHYGLGNFLFGAGSVEAARTGVFEVTVTGRRVDRYRWVPGRITGSVPEPLAGPEADRSVALWEGLRACSGLSP